MILAFKAVILAAHASILAAECAVFSGCSDRLRTLWTKPAGRRKIWPIIGHKNAVPGVTCEHPGVPPSEPPGPNHCLY